MDNIIYMENRATGERTSENIEGNSVKIEGPSNIRLGVTQDDIASQVRIGNDLVLKLQDGTQIILEDYFVFGARSELTIGEEGAALPLEGTSGLLMEGLGLLGVGVLAAASSDGSASTPTVALAKIAAYANDQTAPAPTVQDYANAGVTGVDAANLASVNAAVDAASGAEVDETAELQALVDAVVATDAALAKIAAYANDQTAPAPTVQDYANAGVTGVTADNLADVNAAVDAVDWMAADTTVEIQGLIWATNLEAHNLAAKEYIISLLSGNDVNADLSEFGETFGISVSAEFLKPIYVVAGQSNAGVVDKHSSLRDFLTDSGIDGHYVATAKGGSGIGRNFNSPDWYPYDDSNPATGELLRELINNINCALDQNPGSYLADILWVQGEQDASGSISSHHYQERLEELISVLQMEFGETFNFTISKLTESTEWYTGTSEQQRIVDAQQVISDKFANVSLLDPDAILDASGVDPAHWFSDNIHFSRVSADNLAAAFVRQSVIFDLEDDYLWDKTIEAYSPDGSLQYLTVYFDNGDVKSATLQSIATTTALAKIAAYAADNTQPAPTVQDYADAGVTGVTADNLADVNAAVDAVAGTEADETAEIKGLVGTIAPAAPTVATSNGDTLAGTAEAGSTVTVTLVDGSTVTATADENGEYAFEPNPVPNGQTATLTLTDPAGNVSDPTTVTAVDATAYAPTATLATDTGTAGDGVTNVSTVNVTDIEACATWEYTTDGGANWTDGTGTSFELDQGVYADGVVQVRQTDAAGNVSPSSNLGAVEMLAISLDGVMGSDGTTEFTGGLINPVEVMINGATRTFYHWDSSGDGIANAADLRNHNFIDNLFNEGADTTDADGDRSFTLNNGTILRLPTLNGTSGYTSDQYNNGTAESDHTTYDGWFAIWDAHNGSGTGKNTLGVPDGWIPSLYWSATSTGAGLHAAMNLTSGFSASRDDEIYKYYVALEVV